MIVQQAVDLSCLVADLDLSEEQGVSPEHTLPPSKASPNPPYPNIKYHVCFHKYKEALFESDCIDLVPSSTNNAKFRRNTSLFCLGITNGAQVAWRLLLANLSQSG